MTEIRDGFFWKSSSHPAIPVTAALFSSVNPKKKIPDTSGRGGEGKGEGEGWDWRLGAAPAGFLLGFPLFSRFSPSPPASCGASASVPLLSSFSINSCLVLLRENLDFSLSCPFLESPAVPMECPAGLGGGAEIPPGMLEKAGIFIQHPALPEDQLRVGSSSQGTGATNPGALSFPPSASTPGVFREQMSGFKAQTRQNSQKKRRKLLPAPAPSGFPAQREKFSNFGFVGGLFGHPEDAGEGWVWKGNFLGKMFGWEDLLHGSGRGRPKLGSF